MSRSLSANLQAAVQALITRPIWLIQVDLASTIRNTSDQTNVTYDGNLFTRADVTVQASQIGPTGGASGMLRYQAVDQAFISTFRAANVEGSRVQVWLTDRVSTLPNPPAADAVKFLDLVIDQVVITPTDVTVLLGRKPIYAPDERVDYASGFTDVTGPTVNLPGGTV